MKLVLSLIMFVSLFLTGCSNYDYLVKHTRDIQDKNYYTALAIGYRELAEWERGQYDWNDSNYFARKGVRALNREDVPPSNPDSRDIHNSVHLYDLQAAREKLVDATDTETKIEFPLRSAHLQTLYDSWLEQIEEDWQEVQIKRLRTEFYEKLKQLRENKKLNQRALRKQHETRNFYTIYFDNLSSRLDSSARKEVNKIIYYLKAINNYQIIIEGHTDLLGGFEEEDLLSKHRVLTVKEELLRAGIAPTSIIREESVGSKHRKIKVKLNRTDRINRRVEIYIVTGSE